MGTDSAYDPASPLIPRQRLPTPEETRSPWPIPARGALKRNLSWNWPSLRSSEDGLRWPKPNYRSERAARSADLDALGQGCLVYYFVLDDDPGFDISLGWEKACQAPVYTYTQVVKIGYTSRIRSRMCEVAAEWGPISSVAFESGGPALEEFRHWQFQASRMPAMPLPGGSEFFELSPLLEGHVHWLHDLARWRAGKRSSFPSRPALPIPGLKVLP